MKNFKLLLCLFLFSSASVSAGECGIWNSQIRSLAAAERQVLNEYGFVVNSSDEGKDTPVVVIRDDVIKDCDHRVVAEKYFNNKIDGREKYRIDRRQFDRAKKDVARAACKALSVSVPWVDGISHEIENIADDALRPYWEACIVDPLKNQSTAINIAVFTDSYFESPTSKILSAAGERLKNPSRDLSLDVAFLIFLKRNAGPSISIDDARRLLVVSKPISRTEGAREKEVQAELNLLAARSKIRIEDVYKLMDEIDP